MRSLKNSNSADDNVVVSGADAREIARLLRLLETIQSEVAGPSSAELRSKARALISERNRRARFFGRGMLGEPAWDILLQLYVAEKGLLTIRDLIMMTEEPKTTAIRWISYLENKGFVRRRPDPVDRRLIDIELLDRGRELSGRLFQRRPTARGKHRIVCIWRAAHCIRSEFFINARETLARYSKFNVLAPPER